ncbi:MAG: cupin domain-containing protein [Proteobacteria bacterium]|nr:cupin domain-containing protein [Pseudomonadota bacterium]
MSDLSQVNADFSRRVVIDTAAEPWIPSPQPGVERRLLDRLGGEVARATSLVRYAPGSSFSDHVHGGGEELLVLEGVFSDERGDYPAGTYVRNPPGSKHRPFSRGGCTLFVKLHQFAKSDLQRVVIDTTTANWSVASEAGLSRVVLHQHRNEKVALVRFAPGARVPDDPHPGGEEILVLEGVLSDEAGDYPAGTWVREPAGSAHAPFSREGCVIYVKEGHLPPPV